MNTEHSSLSESSAEVAFAKRQAQFRARVTLRVRQTIDRVREQGLQYEDIERLRCEFPGGPEEERE